MKHLVGDVFYARACDHELLEKGESGGAVSALLKFALESGRVDAVLGVRKGADLYDAVPTLIMDPAEISVTSSSLHSGPFFCPNFSLSTWERRGHKDCSCFKGLRYDGCL